MKRNDLSGDDSCDLTKALEAFDDFEHSNICDKRRATMTHDVDLLRQKRISSSASRR